MLYAIGENKIIRADNDGNTLAEVHFKKLDKHLYEVTEVLTVGDGEEDKDLDKVMRKTLDHMRKNQRKLVTSDPFAKEWFEDHAESYDVYLKEAPKAASSESSSPAKKSAGTDSKKTGTSPVSSKKTSKKKELSSEDLPGGAVRGFGRFLQILCFLAMLAIVGVYGYSFYTTYQEIIAGFSGELTPTYVFLFFSAVFVFVMVLFAFWILSRKTFIVDGEKTKLDTGRGILAFTLILIGVILTPTAVSFTTSTIAASSEYTQIFEGCKGFLTTFYSNASYMVVFSIGGLIGSVIRQFIGR